MLENSFSSRQYSHYHKLPIVESLTPNYLKTSSIVEGLSIDSTNELLLKTIYPKSDSYYYKTDNQLKIARVLAESNPSLQNLVRYGRLLDQNNLCAEAIQFFEKALLKLPENPEILFEIYKFLGNAYLKLGDIDSAEENYNKAFTLKPKSSLLQVNFGTLAIQRKDWHMVQYHFRQALKHNINQDKAWTGLAIYHNYMGDRELAVANLKKALDLNPCNRTALLLLVNWWPNSSPLDEIILRLSQYVDVENTDQEMSQVLIKLAFENQDFQIAKLEIEKLVCLEPTNPVYYQMKTEIEGTPHESK
jgi:Flp pilus assembly protein TadD